MKSKKKYLEALVTYAKNRIKHHKKGVKDYQHTIKVLGGYIDDHRGGIETEEYLISVYEKALKEETNVSRQ